MQRKVSSKEKSERRSLLFGFIQNLFAYGVEMFQDFWVDVWVGFLVNLCMV